MLAPVLGVLPSVPGRQNRVRPAAAGVGPVPAAPVTGNHEQCTWEQIGPCVYCTDHHVRLYQGDLPERKRTIPRCAPLEHDWDPETGMGFYGQCRICGVLEWYE